MRLAISILVDKIMEYGAIVVCEKIPDDRKDKMSAFDNNAFKGFEGMLTQRLSCLYSSKIPKGEPGSINNPYQLCLADSQNDFQNGIVYFVDPSYTGGVDLEQGFVNVFDLDNIKDTTTTRHFLSKFDSIRYDADTNRFAFSFDYGNFKVKKDVKAEKWTIYAGGATVRFNKEYKYSAYIPETATEVIELLRERHSDKDNFAELAHENLSSKEVSALYDIFKIAIYSNIKAHDDVRKLYVSPVNGNTMDYAEHNAIALTRKFKWQQIDKAERGEWVDSVVV